MNELTQDEGDRDVQDTPDSGMRVLVYHQLEAELKNKGHQPDDIRHLD